MTIMEARKEEEEEPVTPTGQYFSSSVMSISILGILEVEIPVDEREASSLLKTVLLPTHPRFSSIMVNDMNGAKKWRRVEVNPDDHVVVPTFPSGLSVESYDEYLDEYLTRIATEPLSESKPLWEIHIFNYPTSKSASNVIFKIHHSLGDGYSLMGVILSCLRRADDPSLPLTFPSRQRSKFYDENGSKSFFSHVGRVCSNIFYSMVDFSMSTLKSCVVEDDISPIRSGGNDVEIRPMSISTITLSLESVKQIKTKLKVTINDVMAGMIFYGIRLYMREISYQSGTCHSTVMVVLNTRVAGEHASVEEMMKPNRESSWGNKFALLHLPIPSLDESQLSDPIEFVKQVQNLVKRKRSSFGFLLTASLMEMVRKFKGPEEGAKLFYNTLKNSSTTISNMIGPMEKMGLNNYPAKGMYFMVAGAPQSLMITMVSYMGSLRIAFGCEKGFIDHHKFKSCLQNSFEMMFKATH